MSTVTSEGNAAVRALSSNGKKRDISIMDVKSQIPDVENAVTNEPPKRGRVRREAAEMGSGDQLTKLFAKATATVVTREDRNAIAVQLNAAKAALALAHKQIEEKDAAFAVVVQERDAVTEKLHRADSLLTSHLNTQSDAIANVPECDIVDRDHETILEERDAAVKERDELTQKLAAATQEHDGVVQKLDATARERDAITIERDTAVQERDAIEIERSAAITEHDEVAQKLATVVQERDELLQKLDAKSQAFDTITIERDTAVQERDTIKTFRDSTEQERDDAVQKLDTFIQKRNALVQELDVQVQSLIDVLVPMLDTLYQERNSARNDHDAAVRERDTAIEQCDFASKERDTVVQEYNAVREQRDDALKERDAAAADASNQQRDFHKLEMKLKKTESIVSWQASQIAILELDEHRIASLELKLEKSYSQQVDDFVEKVYQQIEIGELHRQLSKIKELQHTIDSKDTSTPTVQARLDGARDALPMDYCEYYKQAAEDAASDATFAQQQRDNAYIACNNAQVMAATAAAQNAYYEQLLESQKLTHDSTYQKLIEAQKEVIEVRGMNIILTNDLEAEKKKNADPAVDVKKTITYTRVEPSADNKDTTDLQTTKIALCTAKEQVAKLEAQISATACEITAYLALPKDEQKSRNQPNPGECPCYFHVSRALMIARTLEKCHHDELANINFRQMCTEDELHSLKREVVRPRADMGLQTEEAFPEIFEWEDEGDDEDDVSETGSEESIEIVLSRSSSSPVSSFVSRR